MPDRGESSTLDKNVFDSVKFQEKANPSGSPSTLTGRLHRDLSLVEKGVNDDSLFPRIDIRSAMQMGTFARVKCSKPVLDLARIFSDAGLQSSVGFNMGTCEISLTVPLPEGGGSVRNANQAVIWTMLGVMPHQEELEGMASSWGSDINNQLLGNRCLEAFGKGTGVGISIVKVCWRTRTIRLVLGVYNDLRRGTGKKGLFKYGPSYVTISGLYLSSHEAFEEMFAAEKATLISKMVEDTWAQLEEYPYLVGDDIRAALSPRLFAYFESGVQDQRACFQPAPSAPLSFFLHGPAGAGKSTFVSAFSSAMQRVLRRYVDGARRSEIVKVALNSVTADSLNSILCVQGISDWSIERVVEQTLCKGHTIILHLEEVPADTSVQDRLFSAVRNMLAGLLRRYPHLAGNIIYLFTSNYEPSAALREHAVPVTVHAPAVERQARHCVKMLQDIVQSGAGVAEVAVTIAAPVPAVHDMRMLCSWWLSIGFHLTQQVRALLRGAPASAAAVHATVAGDDERSLRLHVRVEGGDAGRACGEAGAVEGSVRVQAAAEDLLYVCDEAGPGGWEARAKTVVSMCHAGALTPGVVVLRGAEGKRREMEGAVQMLARGVAEGGDKRTMRVSLREEGDQVKVNGHETEIRGGLFKFIDDCNNPNRGRDLEDAAGGAEAGAGAEEGLCVVVCEVNEQGQYMLRELLEGSAQSRTHRYAISKGQVLFVISVDDGAAMQDMTRSRAHAVIDCDQ